MGAVISTLFRALEEIQLFWFMGSALEVTVMKGDAGNEGEKNKTDSKMFSLRDGDNTIHLELFLAF